MPERAIKSASRLSSDRSWACLPFTKTTTQAMMSTTTVRIAVPRLDSMPSMPTLASMDVSAAKTAENTA